MPLSKRIIARLDIKGPRLIKGVRFEGLRVIGDPQAFAVKYAQQGADELLYIDVVASLYGRNGLTDLLRRTRADVFIPVTAGGGVQSEEDAFALLSAGADKVAVNTAFLKYPPLINQLVNAFGSQCVVASIQARQVGANIWEPMCECGRERSGKDLLAWVHELQDRGVGELLITSVDNDGTLHGPSASLIEYLAPHVNVPCIYSGGIRSAVDVASVFENSSVSGVAIGAALHKDVFDISSLRSSLTSSGSSFTLRPLSAVHSAFDDIPVFSNQLSIGVIDYGMGNQQSLKNALLKLGFSAFISSSIDELNQSDVVILPGVGSFPNGMSKLDVYGLDSFIRKWALDGKPILGICLGMQLLFESSTEFSFTPGLSLLSGAIEKLDPASLDAKPCYLPHVGWSGVSRSSSPFSSSLPDEFFQYFVHTYALLECDPSIQMYSSSYGGQIFTSSVVSGNIIGFQFHPELSGPLGLSLLLESINYLAKRFPSR